MGHVLQINRAILTVAAATAVVGMTAPLDAAVTVTSRDSTINFRTFAASGPETDEFILDPVETSLTAGWIQAIQDVSFVDRNDEPVAGSGRSEGDTGRNDVLIYEEGELIEVQSSAVTTMVEAEHIDGGGIGQASCVHALDLRFEITGASKLFRIVGNTTVSNLDEVFAEVRVRKFTPQSDAFRITTVLGQTGDFDVTGILEPGSYQLWARTSTFVQRFSTSDPFVETESANYDFIFTLACAGDLNDDDSVGVSDLLSMLAEWGDCKGCSSDLNGDGNVSTLDLLLILAGWGSCD